MIYHSGIVDQRPKIRSSLEHQDMNIQLGTNAFILLRRITLASFQKILMDFFGLTNKQIQIFVADKIEDNILLEKIKSVYKI